ncbi:restriction endonuclease subunit S [Mycoplasma mycoides subsp. capri]|nr:restriction endonuclease subunit S [Mycoplasma mycoides subsp. capri]
MFNIDRGLGITKKDMSSIKTGDFKYPVYSSQTTENGLIGYYNKYTFEDAITWTTDGAKAGTVFYRKHSFFATSHCGILTKKHFNVNEYFSIIISKNTSKSVTWVAMPMLTTSEMEKMKIISSSDPKEQQKISLLISTLDSLITLHQRGYKWRENKWKKTIYCYTNIFKIE